LKSIAIDKYIDEYHTAHVPIDYDFSYINLNDIEFMYETFRNNSEKYNNLNLKKNYSINKYGFKYLNSDECICILDEMKSIEKEIIIDLNDEKLTSTFSLWEEINNKRENEMVKNLFIYSTENDYNDAVFIFGVAHKKSILQKIKSYKSKYEIKINWKLYGFENLNII
jgi:hypothetical protein